MCSPDYFIVGVYRTYKREASQKWRTWGGAASSVNATLQAFGVAEVEKTYGREFDTSTHLFQVSIDSIPGLHFVLRCASVS